MSRQRSKPHPKSVQSPRIGVGDLLCQKLVNGTGAPCGKGFAGLNGLRVLRIRDAIVALGLGVRIPKCRLHQNPHHF